MQQSYALPSFSSLSGNVGRAETAPHLRQAQVPNSPSNDISYPSRQQIESRDQTIEALRVEQSRIQAVCEQLQTRSQVTKRELATLIEEKSELDKQALSLRGQVEELSRDKEQLQNESQANASQWRQIMAMSSKLQMQSVEETRRFNSDRQTWAQEREKLEQRLLNLQSGQMLQRTDTQESSDTSISGDPSRRMMSMTITSMSEDQLRLEVDVLRERCQELEHTLTTLLKESSNVERVAGVFKEVRARMAVTRSPTSDKLDVGDRKRPRS